VRLFHRQYEVKRDRVTGILFSPARLDGKAVAAADVSDERQVRDLLARGWEAWPGQVQEAAPLPPAEDLEALTIPQLRALAGERGVELGPRGTKAQLIEALQAATAAAAEDAEAGAD
jgi:hypothetical protein